MIINRTSEFKRSYKKLKRKHYDMDKLKKVIEVIVKNDIDTLRQKHKLHQLKGKYHGLSEVHVDRQYNDNWLLVYAIRNEQLTILDLIDTGSHDQIFR